MAIPNLAARMPKCISPAVMVPGSTWILRAFVTATGPLEKKYVDKETCEKVKDAAEAIKEGMKETRQTGQFVKETANANAGEVITEMAKKAIDVVAEEKEKEEEEEGTWEKLKLVVKGKTTDGK